MDACEEDADARETAIRLALALRASTSFFGMENSKRANEKQLQSVCKKKQTRAPSRRREIGVTKLGFVSFFLVSEDPPLCEAGGRSALRRGRVLYPGRRLGAFGVERRRRRDNRRHFCFRRFFFSNFTLTYIYT